MATCAMTVMSWQNPAGMSVGEAMDQRVDVSGLFFFFLLQQSFDLEDGVTAEEEAVDAASFAL